MKSVKVDWVLSAGEDAPFKRRHNLVAGVFDCQGGNGWRPTALSVLQYVDDGRHSTYSRTRISMQVALVAN